MGVSPRINTPRSDVNQEYTLLNPLDLRYSGHISLERIISKKGSLHIHAAQSTIFIPNELRYGTPALRLPFARENYSNRVRELGLRYRIYSDIAPLRYFFGFGVNYIQYETPNYRIGQSQLIYSAEGSYVMGSIEFGATKIYRDRFVVTYAIGSNMRRFNIFIPFEDNYHHTDFEDVVEAMDTRTAFYTTKSMGLYARISFGYIF